MPQTMPSMEAIQQAVREADTTAPRDYPQPDIRFAHCGGSNFDMVALPHQSKVDIPSGLVAAVTPENQSR